MKVRICLCRWLIGALGYRECCLFTDLANPTSNKIYEAIGYRGVCDLYGMTFVKDRKP